MFVFHSFLINIFTYLFPIPSPHILLFQVCFFSDKNTAIPRHYFIWISSLSETNWIPSLAIVSFFFYFNLLILLLDYVMVSLPSFLSLFSSLNTLWYPQFPSTGTHTISPHSWTWRLNLVQLCVFAISHFPFSPLPFGVVNYFSVCMKPFGCCCT